MGFKQFLAEASLSFADIFKRDNRKGLVDKLKKGELLTTTGEKLDKVSPRSPLIKLIKDMGETPDKRTEFGKLFKQETGVAFSKIDKGENGFSTTVKISDAKSTAKQELGSAWILRRAIKDNIKYEKWEDIKNDPKFSELKKIYPEVDKEWLQGYYLQQETMLKEFSDVSFNEFNRDGGFMDYITKLTKEMGITQKDTWNPADIWLIKDEKKVISTIEKAIKDTPTKTISELNAILRKLYVDRKLIGVSLKKISGKVAKFEEVNVDLNLGLNDDYNFKIEEIRINLAFKTKFETQDSVVMLNTKKGHKIKFQIKGNNSKGIANLKWEGTDYGANSARLGKAPVEMVKQIFPKFTNSNKLFPKTLDEYTAYKKNVERMFNKIKTYVNGVNTFKSVDANFKKAFSSKNKEVLAVANSKIMQMAFLEQLVKLSKKDRESAMTDMVFISMKKGEKFGPFGKLY